MDQKIQELLYSRGVFRHYQGYDYFVRSVHLVLEEPERLQHMYKELYLPIAIEYKKDVRTVEKNIRTIRDIFVKNGGGSLLAEMGGGPFWNDKRPYPKEMIEIFASYLKSYLQETSKALL